MHPTPSEVQDPGRVPVDLREWNHSLCQPGPSQSVEFHVLHSFYIFLLDEYSLVCNPMPYLGLEKQCAQLDLLSLCVGYILRAHDTRRPSQYGGSRERNFLGGLQ